ncbi:MAG TPA: hypothetical protein DCF45_00455 [Gammaproteobacteria bacterium]|nr:hypothetical protein [Gammaproteobacteria bacterium]
MATTSFKFDQKTSKVLENLRDHYGAASKAEILRKAIALLDIAAEADDKKQKLVIESEDGSTKREIVIK